jgi:hypothetical protein
MNWVRNLSALAAGLLLVTPAIAGGERPVVVELFTSQGCSSCPPADALLGRLTERHDLIAVSLPITYWDMLGWKDTLATQANTHRQKAYAQAMGKGGVYTPEIVVDGVSDVVGSRESDVLATIAKRETEIAKAHAEWAEHAALASELIAREGELAARKAELVARVNTEEQSEMHAHAVKASLVEAREDLAAARQDAVEAARESVTNVDLSIPVKVTESPSEVRIDVGQAGEKSDGPATVWLFHLRNTVTVNIGAGENDGRTMTYHNVVSDLRSVGKWGGAEATFDVPRTSLAGLPHDAVAVIVQKGGYGRVVGATMISHPDYDPSN